MPLSRYLKILHRFHCEQFRVGTIFSLYYCAEGSVHLLLDERLTTRLVILLNNRDVMFLG